jgi:hypothetical protein
LGRQGLGRDQCVLCKHCNRAGEITPWRDELAVFSGATLDALRAAAR